MGKLSVVIIDDVSANLKLLSGILSRPDYMIRPIPDPVTALNAIKAEPPDIILLDIMMPAMSGYDICKSLKSDPATCDIPVIFITAKDDVEDKVKGFNLGAVDYITKPFQADDVAARVQTHLKIYTLQKKLKKRTQDMEELNIRLEYENNERRKVEEALRESYLWLQSVFNALEEAVFILNSERKIINVNPAAEKMFGYTKEELKKKAAVILHVDFNHYVEFGNKIDQAFEKGEGVSFEYSVKRRNGEIFPSEHNISLLRSAADKCIGIVSVVRDLTEKKETEKKLRESAKLETILEIAGAVCHEMNQPLMHISGYSELILMDIPPDSPAYSKVKKIQQQTDRMAQITKRLMHISRYKTKDYPDGKIIDLYKSSE